jgi:hypothetical protein
MHWPQNNSSHQQTQAIEINALLPRASLYWTDVHYNNLNIPKVKDDGGDVESKCCGTVRRFMFVEGSVLSKLKRLS